MKALILRFAPPFLLPLIERIEASQINRRLARGTFWSVLGAFFARGLSVLAAVVVARCLGKETFGQFGIIQITILNLSALTSYSITMTATKHIAELRVGSPDRAGRVLALIGLTSFITSGILSLGLFFGSDWLAANTLAAPELSRYLKIGTLMLFFVNQNASQTATLAGFEAFKTMARINLITGVITFIGITAGVFFKGLIGAVWGLSIANAIAWGVTHLAVRRELKDNGVVFSIRGARTELPILWRFSLPALLAGILYGPVGWACSAILVNQPGGYAEMGFFNATNQWFNLVMFIPGLLGQVVLPMFSVSIGRGDRMEVRRIIGLAVKVNGTIALALVIVASILSPFLMSLYGEVFREAWPALVIALVTAGVVAVQTPLGEVLNADGRQWFMFWIHFAWAGVFLFFTLILVPHGVFGFVTARLTAFAIKGICLMVALNFVLKGNTKYSQ